LSLLNQLLAALSVTGPVVLLLIVGVFLKKIELVNDAFISGGNKLVFNVTLPCLLFLNVATNSFAESLDIALVGYAVIATVLSVLLIYALSHYFVSNPSEKGVFTQCAFRGNMAIVGLALCVNAFGDGVIALGATYLAFLTVLYNILAVLLLSKGKLASAANILKNPLIISIALGGLWSVSNIKVPEFIQASLKYLSSMTLPLALLCIGASLDWKSFKNNQRSTIIASGIKLILQPLVILVIAVFLGFRGESLGILFFMMASPTAAAAYIMSRQMSPHGNLAAEIISITTAFCPITLTLGLALLGYFGYI